MTFALDAAARAKRGLNFSWLTGPLAIKLKAPLTRASAEVEIDLTQAGVDNPVPGLSKPAGKPGKATFLVKPAPEGASLSNIAIDMGGPMMRGSAQMGADGAVQSATITSGAHRARRRFQGRRRQWADVVQCFGARRLARRARLRKVVVGRVGGRTRRGEGLRPRRQDRDCSGRKQTGDHRHGAHRRPPRAARRASGASRDGSGTAG